MRTPRPAPVHRIACLSACLALLACGPREVDATAEECGPTLAATEVRAFTGAPVRSVLPDAVITPLAWVHPDTAAAARPVVTVVFLYNRGGFRGEQVKIATISADVDPQGRFIGSYGDVRRLSGVLAPDRLTLSATILSRAGLPDDVLDGVELKPAGAPALPEPGEQRFIDVLPVTDTAPVYSDFSQVSLAVTRATAARESATQVVVTYETSSGAYRSPPRPIDPATGAFSGAASGRKGEIRFAGVFVPVGGPTEGGLYPILSQSLVNGGVGSRLSDAGVIHPIVWLREARTRSGLEMATASYNTASAAQTRLAALAGDKTVVSADTDDRTTGATAPPNDPYFNPAHGTGQYPYPTLNGQLCCTQGIHPVLPNDAWGVANATGQGVVAAVLDSGVDRNHPDLAGKVLGGHNGLAWPWWCEWLRPFIPANWRTDAVDLYGHGTGVAGVITAHRDNGVGVAGTAASPRVIPVRVLDESLHGRDSYTVDGLLWLLDNDLGDLINLSFVSPQSDPNVAALLRRAVEGGRVVFAATGNSPTPVIPAAAGMPDIVSVAASDPDDAPADYSGFGRNLDLLAPGGTLPHPIPVLWAATSADECTDPVFDGDPAYCLKFGTSFATPYATALGAMVLTRFPALAPRSPGCAADRKACVGQVMSLLQATGRVVDTPDWADFGVTQARVVQAYDALTAPLAPPPPRPGALQSPGCADVAACTAPGLPLQWVAAPPSATLALQGYLIYRNGALLLQPNSPNPYIVVGNQFDDPSLPQQNGGLVPNHYDYTVTALYQDADGVLRESLSTAAIRVTCTALACH